MPTILYLALSIFRLKPEEENDYGCVYLFSSSIRGNLMVITDPLYWNDSKPQRYVWPRSQLLPIRHLKLLKHSLYQFSRNKTFTSFFLLRSVININLLNLITEIKTDVISTDCGFDCHFIRDISRKFSYEGRLLLFKQLDLRDAPK